MIELYQFVRIFRLVVQKAILFELCSNFNTSMCPIYLVQ